MARAYRSQGSPFGPLYMVAALLTVGRGRVGVCAFWLVGWKAVSGGAVCLLPPPNSGNPCCRVQLGCTIAILVIVNVYLWR